jgi:hypothetical protein
MNNLILALSVILTHLLALYFMLNVLNYITSTFIFILYHGPVIGINNNMSRNILTDLRVNPKILRFFIAFSRITKTVNDITKFNLFEDRLLFVSEKDNFLNIINSHIRPGHIRTNTRILFNEEQIFSLFFQITYIIFLLNLDFFVVFHLLFI